MKKEKKPLSLRTKDNLLTATSVLVTITPLLVAVGINFNDYFIRSTGVQVGFGGMLSLILLIFMTKGNTTWLKGVWGYLIVFIIAVCLQPIIQDIVLLSGMALAGKTADSLFIKPQLNRVRRMRDSTEKADIMSDNIVKAMNDHIKRLGG